MTKRGGVRVWGEAVYDEYLDVDDEHLGRVASLQRSTESSDSTAALLSDGRWVFAASLPALPNLCPKEKVADQLILILVKSTMGRDGDEYDVTMLYALGDDRMFGAPDQLTLTESNTDNYDPVTADRLCAAAELAASYGWFNEAEAQRIATHMEAAAAAMDGQ